MSTILISANTFDFEPPLLPFTLPSDIILL